MTVNTQSPHLAKLFEHEEQQMPAVHDGPSRHESKQTNADGLQGALDFAASQLPGAEYAPELHRAFHSFTERMYEQGGEAIGMFGNNVRRSAQEAVNTEENERQEDLNDLCGGGVVSYVAPKEIVDKVIKKTLADNGASTEIVDAKGFFHERLETVRAAASTLVINNSLDERAAFRRGYNEERRQFDVSEAEAFTDDRLAKETEPLIQEAVTSVVEQLGAELRTLREAKVARVALTGGAMKPEAQKQAMLKAIEEANHRIAAVLKLKGNDPEISRIAKKVLANSGYAEVNEANMLLLKNKKAEFVKAMTSAEKLTLLSQGLKSTKEYKELEELGLHTAEIIVEDKFTSESLVGMDASTFKSLINRELRAQRTKLGDKGPRFVTRSFARLLHPDVISGLDISDGQKAHLEELSKILLSTVQDDIDAHAK